MRSSRLWLVLLVAAVVGALAWTLGLLPQPGAGSRDDAAPAPGALEASAPDAAVEASRLAGTGGRAPEAPVVPPRPPIPEGMARLSGVVVDRQGKGLAGARVVSIPDTTVKTYFPRDVGGEGFPGFDAITDADGRFVVAMSKASTNQSLVVIAEGYAPTLKRDVGAATDLRVVLERAGALVGTVTNVESEPVAKANVRAMFLLDVIRIEQEAVTDATGAYRIEGWAAATKATTWWQPTRAIVEAVGYAPLFLDRVPAAAPGAEARRDFVVVRGATVSGRVVEAETEKPVPGLSVVLWSMEGQTSIGRAMGQASVPMPWGPRRLAETTSAADGTFRFEHVPSNGFHPIASHSGGRKGIVLGFVSAWVEGRAAASEEIPALADGGTLEVTLKLVAAGGIAGRVVDAAGKPVSKVTVYPRLAPGVVAAWIPKDLYPDAPAAWAEPTGEDGRYRLPWIPIPGGAATDQLFEARVKTEVASYGGRRDPDGTLTVRLLPGTVVEAPDLVLTEAKPATDGEIAGIPVRVEDPRGAPVEGATVSWAVNSGQSQRTDAQGRATFFVGRLRPGQTIPPLRMLVRAKGFAATPFEVPWTQAAPELVLVRLAAAHRLAGTVRQADGTPAAGASVRVANGTVPPADAFPEGTPDALLGQDTPKPGAPTLVHYGATSTDDEGRFRFEDLPEGPYTVVASGSPRSAAAAGFDAKPLRDVRPGVPTDSVELELRLPVDDSPLPGSFEGTVVDAATKRPILRFTVQREGGSGGITRRVGSGMYFSPGLQVELTAPGRYEAAAVLPGSYTLLVQAQGYVRARVPDLEVRAGERSVVRRIELDRGLTLKGRIALPAGVDASTLGLSFVCLDDETFSLTASIDAAGRYERAGLVPGRWLARVQSTSFRPEGVETWAFDDGGFVTIAEGAATTTRDLTLVPGARMYVELSDVRLPPGQHDGGTATPEQKAFGEGASLRITAPDGTVLVYRKGLTRGWGPWSWHAVKPGRYVVRAELPGGEVIEHAIDAEAGKEARLPGAPK